MKLIISSNNTVFFTWALNLNNCLCLNCFYMNSFVNDFVLSKCFFLLSTLCTQFLFVVDIDVNYTDFEPTHFLWVSEHYLDFFKHVYVNFKNFVLLFDLKDIRYDDVLYDLYLLPWKVLPYFFMDTRVNCNCHLPTFN